MEITYVNKGACRITALALYLVAAGFLATALAKDLGLIEKTESTAMSYYSGFLILAFAMLATGFLFSSQKLSYSFIGGSFLLMGISSGVTAFFTFRFGMLILLPFAALGGLILYRGFFLTKEENKELVDENNNTRMLIVRDVVYLDYSSTATVILALAAPSAGESAHFTYDEMYFSYDTTESEKFYAGMKYGIDLRKLTPYQNTREVRGYQTTDITGLPIGAFKELPAVLEKLFSKIDM